jgi:DNA polymerase elongation subunit (family B)
MGMLPRSRLFGSVEDHGAWPNDDLVVQVVSWHALDDGKLDDGGGEGGGDRGDSRASYRGVYTVRAFCVTERGESVGLNLRGFTPFFYVKVPECAGSSSSSTVRSVQRFLVQLADEMHAGMIGAKSFRKRDFWGFTDGKEEDFVRMSFGSQGGMRHMAARLRKSQKIQGVGYVELALYEANIDPLLRFFHIRDLLPAGWIRVKAGRFSKASEDDECVGSPTTCQLNASAHWTDVIREARDDVAPLVIASFDIECNSAHGDFPVASKDYRKMGIELEQAWELGRGSNMPVKSAPNEYEAKRVLTRCMMAAFGLEEDGGAAMSVMQLKKIPATETGKKALVNAVHRAVDEVHLVLSKGKGALPPAVGIDDDDEGAKTNPLLHEIVSRLNRAFGTKWPLQGDEIIQIGMTVNLYGEKECCARYIYVLGTCDPVKGAEVRAFEDEADMLLSWAQLVHDVDPDVLLGYNIFGFDFDYMHTRAAELLGESVCEQRFCRLGRIEGMPSKLIKQELSSSAMGDNILKYMDMHGRVTVDLMKVVQVS